MVDEANAPGPADVFLVLGTACAAAGAWLVLGLGEALVVLGVLMLAAGVLIGRREA